ncbi:MarR family transcriptional regulator [Nocardioides sp.]|uniref:MarR family winged helix-turn-helix transcriptional regulator n=1 Tax=Nocardioides sp. TaxID=35761 RepID=UPI0025E034D5|nr:MarR family transcriptional regulator [Nocardioides sp.]
MRSGKGAAISPHRGDDLALERATLALVNMVAYTGSSRRHAHTFSRCTGVALPNADIRFLEYLSGRGALAVSAVASALAIDLSLASRHARELAAIGLVQRTSDPEDRRRTLVRLTSRGRDLLDRWLLAWSADYETPIQGWPEGDVERLAEWFDLVHLRLAAALPDRPQAAARERWLDLSPSEQGTPAHRRLVSSVVGLIAWVGQSRGFDELLVQLRAPIRQLGFFTLRVVSREGPLSVAEVADRMGVEHSQASRRLTQLSSLGLVDRAVDAFDRRSNLVRVSRRGRTLERRVLEAQLQGFSGILDPMGDDQREQLTGLVERYVGGLLAEPAAERA